MANIDYREQFKFILTENFVGLGYKITRDVELDIVPENAKYDALTVTLNDHKIVYRKGKVTPDRPGAFLAIWQRPAYPNTTDINLSGNKPIPLTEYDLDYLFIKVEEHPKLTDEQSACNKPVITKSKQGMFIFPVTLLVKKGIVLSEKRKGKTGFRVFPPWSQDRGNKGTKVFSESGKKTQSWQLPYYVAIDEQGLIDPIELNKALNAA